MVDWIYLDEWQQVGSFIEIEHVGRKKITSYLDFDAHKYYGISDES